MSTRPVWVRDHIKERNPVPWEPEEMRQTHPFQGAGISFGM